MKTVPYSDILNATLQLAGIDRTSLSKKTFNTFRDFFSKRIAEIWNKERWPDFVQYVTRYPGMQLYRIDYTPIGGYLSLYFCKDKSSEYYEETNFDTYPYSNGGTITIQLPQGVLSMAPTSSAISATATISFVGDFTDPTGVETTFVQCTAPSLNGTSAGFETVYVTYPRFQAYPFNNYIGSCVLTKNGEDGAEVTPIYRTKLPANADTVQGVTLGQPPRHKRLHGFKRTAASPLDTSRLQSRNTSSHAQQTRSASSTASRTQWCGEMYTATRHRTWLERSSFTTATIPQKTTI